MDQPRVARQAGVRVEAQLLHRAESGQVIDEDVGAVYHALQDRLALGGGDVERQAALVAVRGHKVGGFAVDERRPPATRLVALAAALDLDDVRAHVAQVHGAVRPRQRLGHVDDAEAGEERLVRSFHVRLVILVLRDASSVLRIPSFVIRPSSSRVLALRRVTASAISPRRLRSRSRRFSEIDVAGPPRSTLIISAMMQIAISAGVCAPMAMPMGA